MKIKKQDWTLVREAREKGLLVSMTGTVAPKRTSLNIELSRYFKQQLPDYLGVFDEEEGEDVLYELNKFLKENNIDKRPLEFPYSDGNNTYLIPVTPNLQMVVVAADEYYGSGDYAKYVMIDSFVITENATKEDVDKLIALIKRLI